jgi:hypothetical protein
MHFRGPSILEIQRHKVVLKGSFTGIKVFYSIIKITGYYMELYSYNSYICIH